MPATLADLLRRPDDVGPMVSPTSLRCSAVTWQVLCRDGAVVELRPGFGLLAGVAPTPADRAQTLVGAVPRGVVVARAWAVWIHAGGRPPSPLRRVGVVYRPGTSRPRSVPGLEPVQTSLRPWDVVMVGGLPVTSPVRTAMDVATWSTGPEAARDLVRLRRSGADLPAGIAQLRRVSGWRGSLQAVRRLETANWAVPEPVDLEPSSSQPVAPGPVAREPHDRESLERQPVARQRAEHQPPEHSCEASTQVRRGPRSRQPWNR